MFFISRTPCVLEIFLFAIFLSDAFQREGVRETFLPTSLALCPYYKSLAVSADFSECTRKFETVVRNYQRYIKS